VLAARRPGVSSRPSTSRLAVCCRQEPKVSKVSI
jgi:hypothetical protein